MMSTAGSKACAAMPKKADTTRRKGGARARTPRETVDSFCNADAEPQPEEVALAPLSASASSSSSSAANKAPGVTTTTSTLLYEADEKTSGVVFLDSARPVYEFLRDFAHGEEEREATAKILFAGNEEKYAEYQRLWERDRTPAVGSTSTSATSASTSPPRCKTGRVERHQPEINEENVAAAPPPVSVDAFVSTLNEGSTVDIEQRELQSGDVRQAEGSVDEQDDHDLHVHDKSLPLVDDFLSIESPNNSRVELAGSQEIVPEYDVAVSKGEMRLWDDALKTLILQTTARNDSASKAAAVLDEVENDNENKEEAAGEIGDAEDAADAVSRTTEGASGPPPTATKPNELRAVDEDDDEDTGATPTRKRARAKPTPSGAKLTVAMQNAEVLVVSSTMLIVTHSGSTCMGLPPIDFDAYEDKQVVGLQDLSPRSVARLRAEKIEQQHAAEQAHEDDYGHSTAHLDRMLDPDSHSTIAATSKKAKSPSALPPRIMYGIILHDAGLLKLDALADILRTKCNCIVMEPRYENTAELVGYWARTGAMGLSTVIRGGAKVIASGIKLGSGVAIQREWIPRYQTETGEVQKLAVSSPVRNSVKYTKEASGWLSDSTKQTIQNAVKGVREKLADEKGTWKEWLNSASRSATEIMSSGSGSGRLPLASNDTSSVDAVVTETKKSEVIQTTVSASSLTNVHLAEEQEGSDAQAQAQTSQSQQGDALLEDADKKLQEEEDDARSEESSGDSSMRGSRPPDVVSSADASGPSERKQKSGSNANQQTIQSAKTVGFSGILAGVEVFSAMYEATTQIISSTAHAAADIAGHRYGDEVHSVAKDSVEIAQNLLEVKESLSGKAVATQVAKETL